jgi:hypothetical protein
MDTVHLAQGHFRPESQNRAAAPPARPGRNLGLGRVFGPARGPSWAVSGPSAGRPPLTVGSNPMSGRRSRRIKNRRSTEFPGNPTTFFSSLFFCSGPGGGAAAGDSHRHTARSGRRPASLLSYLPVSSAAHARRARSSPHMRSGDHGQRGK